MKQLHTVADMRTITPMLIKRLAMAVLLCVALSGCLCEPPPPPPPKTDWVVTVAVAVASGITCLFIGMLLMAGTHRAARQGRGTNEYEKREEA